MKFFTRIAAPVFAAACLGLAATPDFSHAQSPDLAAAGSRVGLWVVLDAKQGKEEDVARFLRGGKAIVDGEPATTTWYAVRLSATRFAIFDTFSNDAGRDAHLSGKVAAALAQQAPELLQKAPSIEKIDVLALKLPSAR